MKQRKEKRLPFFKYTALLHTTITMTFFKKWQLFRRFIFDNFTKCSSPLLFTETFKRSQILHNSASILLDVILSFDDCIHTKNVLSLSSFKFFLHFALVDVLSLPVATPLPLLSPTAEAATTFVTAVAWSSNGRDTISSK